MPVTGVDCASPEWPSEPEASLGANNAERRLIFEGLMLLLYFDLVMHFRDFKALYECVRNCKTKRQNESPVYPVAALCQALDLACVFYFKHAKCLQRSAATTVLLRRYGWKAEMVIGAQISPFTSHAWVEISGNVANDKSYMRDIYQELDRC